MAVCLGGVAQSSVLTGRALDRACPRNTALGIGRFAYHSSRRSFTFGPVGLGRVASRKQRGNCTNNRASTISRGSVAAAEDGQPGAKNAGEDDRRRTRRVTMARHAHCSIEGTAGQGRCVSTYLDWRWPGRRRRHSPFLLPLLLAAQSTRRADKALPVHAAIGVDRRAIGMCGRRADSPLRQTGVPGCAPRFPRERRCTRSIRGGPPPNQPFPRVYSSTRTRFLSTDPYSSPHILSAPLARRENRQRNKRTEFTKFAPICQQVAVSGANNRPLLTRYPQRCSIAEVTGCTMSRKV
uniref:Uncharacterized protein n=1 Tax=Plectus sambesii TaxID=2011161 RepID=A0A914X8R5_9BILA